jgi:hypothetical protein
MSDGIIERKSESRKLERIQLTLNHYGLANVLIKAGHVPEGFTIENAWFEEDNQRVLKLYLVRETALSEGYKT